MFFLNAKDLTVSPTRTGPDDLEIGSTDDLLNKVGSQTLISFYNRAVPSAPVKKFVNRATAATRTFPLMERMANGESGPPSPIKTSSDEDPWELPPESSPRKTGTAPDDGGNATQEDDVATATKGKRKGAKGTKSTKSTGAKRGRAPGLAGARLIRVGDENPCRDGGIRAAAWDLVPTAGISYEKFIEKGGNTSALAFNIRQGRTKVERAK